MANDNHLPSVPCYNGTMQNNKYYNNKRKRLIFRYDRKIPDYFSVVGAP
ncbi:hypothetical protein F170042I7_31040 [Blautia caecimuris]